MSLDLQCMKFKEKVGRWRMKGRQRELVLVSSYKVIATQLYCCFSHKLSIELYTYKGPRFLPCSHFYSLSCLELAFESHCYSVKQTAGVLGIILSLILISKVFVADIDYLNSTTPQPQNTAFQL